MSKRLILSLLIVSLIAMCFCDKCDSLVANGNCDFYTECLEEKYHCGVTGYPVGYGHRYCNKFLKYFYDFPPLGQLWVQNTLVCLKTALQPLFHETSDCATIYSVAFASHPRCYFESGFCELFKDRKNIIKTLKALLEVYEIKDFMSATTMKQVFETAKMCGSEYVAEIKQAMKDIFSNGRFLE